MHWQDWYLLGAIRHDTFRYFLSALTQSAAAFAALTAVFAVFRLQVSQNLLRERLSEAKSWLAGWNPPQAFVFSDAQAKEQLKNVQRDRKPRADDLLSEIKRWEDLNERLPNELRLPLKWWAYLFFFSLLGLAISEFLAAHSLPLVVAYLSGAAGGLWRSKRFIESCLQASKQTAP